MPNTKHKIPQKDALPENFTSFDEFDEFWNTHSSADYEDQMTPIEADIQLSSEKIYCPIAKDVMLQVRTRAHQQGVSAETLVNLWIQEKVAQPA